MIMKRYVAQWTDCRWVNCHDERGYTIYFNSIEEAKDYIEKIDICRDVVFRICEYLGGRKYIEVVPPKTYKSHR